MLASALRRHIGYRPLQDFQQSLLHAFTGYVARDGGVLAFTGDLVDLINIDDAALGTFDIEIRCLYQSEKDIFHVLSYISRLGKGGGVRDGKGHAQGFGKRLREVRLADAGRTEQQDIGFLNFHILQLIQQRVCGLT